jgi:hypothetical protein
LRTPWFASRSTSASESNPYSSDSATTATDGQRLVTGAATANHFGQLLQ